MRGGRKLALTLCSSCRLSLQRAASTCPFTGRAGTDESTITSVEHRQTLHSLEDTHTDVLSAQRTDTPRHIPGPLSLPGIGTLYKYLPYVGSYSITDQMGTDRQRYRDYGPVVKETLYPGFTIYHIYDLDMIKEVYNHEKVFPNRFALPGLEAYREYKKTESKGLSLSVGKEWLKQRRAASDLMKPQYIANFFDDQIHIADDFTKIVTTSADDQGEIPDLLNLCYRYALESTGNVLFGERLGTLEASDEARDEANKLIDAVLQAMKALYVTTYFWPLHQNRRTKVWKELCSSIDHISETGMKYAQQLMDSPETGKISYMRTLLSKPDLTLQDALTVVCDVIFAGVETTGLVILYNMYNLARNPEKQERLYQEIIKYSPHGSPITTETLDQMKYLKAVIKETFRFTPLGVGNARILSRDMHYKGYTFPKKSLMLLNNTMACESPEYVTDPKEFRPERWLSDADEKLHPYLILPFGLGSRSCLGRKLSTMEMQIAILKIVKEMKLEYNHEGIGFVTRFGNVPDRPVRLNVTKRNP